MIDPHVHLRDGKQAGKETVSHGLRVAARAGLDGVFEMPNTDPPLTSETLIRERIALTDDAVERISAETGMTIFHGIYAGLTADEDQIGRMVELHSRLFPRLVGLKMFAGSSTGDLAILSEKEQLRVFEALTRFGYRGVLAVHCEKESLMETKLWNPESPVSHTRARPPICETASVRDMIAFSRKSGFEGVLHICHISLDESVRLVDEARGALRVTCGATPHHLLLPDSAMNRAGGILKMNPPLRSEENRSALVRHLMEGRIDWIETDHAPHTLEEKRTSMPSGIPGFPIYPRLLEWLKKKKASEALLESITHGNIAETYGIEVENTRRNGEADLSVEYQYDPFEGWRS